MLGKARNIGEECALSPLKKGKKERGLKLLCPYHPFLLLLRNDLPLPRRYGWMEFGLARRSLIWPEV